MNKSPVIQNKFYTKIFKVFQVNPTNDRIKHYAIGVRQYDIDNHLYRNYVILFVVQEDYIVSADPIQPSNPNFTLNQKNENKIVTIRTEIKWEVFNQDDERLKLAYECTNQILSERRRGPIRSAFGISAKDTTDDNTQTELSDSGKRHYKLLKYCLKKLNLSPSTISPGQRSVFRFEEREIRPV